MDKNVQEAGEGLSKVSISSQNKELSEEEQEIFAELISNAKQLTTEGKIKDALDLYKQAIKMYHHEKLARKIQKMEAYLVESTKSPACGRERKSSSSTPINDLPISPDNQEIYKQLISGARNLVEEGKILDALELNKQALQIYPNEKLEKKIAKMEMYLKNVGNQESARSDDKSEPSGSKSSTSDSPPKKTISSEQKEIFEQLIHSARTLAEEGKISDALEMYKEAYKICNNEKLGRKIGKIEKYLEQNRSNQGNGQNSTTNNDRQTDTAEDTNSSEPQQSSSASEETSKKRSVSVEDQENYNQLIQTAKLYIDEGKLKDALELYREAIKIYSSEKLAKKIAKVEAYLKESDSNRDEENHTEGNISEQSDRFVLPPLKTPKKEKSDVMEEYNKLVQEAKQLIGEGKVKAALDLNRQALKICHSDKLAKKIAKMEQYIKMHGDEDVEEDENGMVHVGKGYFMYKELYEKLYDHQKEAVLWMWGLHQKRKGGILGDDMGLGKTIQIISFLSGLFDMDKAGSVLIVMPVSLIVNWEKEFQKWAPGIRVEAYYGSSKKEKERALAKVQRRGGVLLTSYGLVVTSWESLGKQDGREFVWDYVILDEGHKIKNPTKTTKGVHAIPAKNRIILTGTPIQNNLKELWALFDFVHQGSLLGTARTFKMEYDTPITRARERDATIGERRLGQEMAESLKKIIAPYFLRRTKAEVTETKDGVKVKKEEDGGKYTNRMPSLTRKNDLIMWCYLTQTQQKIYHDFLSLDSVKELLMTKKSPLVALTVLKKITDHPRLLSTRAVAQLGIDDQGLDEDQLESEEAYRSAVDQIKNVEDHILVNESGKLIVLVDLLDKLKEEGHRTLVFSQSRKLLDIIEKVISNRGHHVMRLDGTITHLIERDQRMKKFQTDDKYSVFLLTTQVGGVGLTLTAADRVVIYDPSWNPATDNQAVDRAFRIGQEKNVVIYRMITCGTVEEKIYRRQIFKDSITRQATGNSKNPYRYFTKQELRELFQLDNPRVSSTQQQLEEMHSGFRKSDQSLDAHIAYLHSLDIFGISDHDLMFGKVKDNMDDLDEGCEEDHGNDYIQARVQKAQELLKMESDLSQPMSHYPSENNSNRQRGPVEWNMPTSTRSPPSGPDDVVDLNQEESDDDHGPVRQDSDTEMVDLTDTPPKSKENTEETRKPATTNIKQEVPITIDDEEDDLPAIGTPKVKPNDVKREPHSPVIKQEPSHSNAESDEELPKLSTEKIKPSKEDNPICVESDEEHMKGSESLSNHASGETDEISIESDKGNDLSEEENTHLNESESENRNNLENVNKSGHNDMDMDEGDVQMASPVTSPMKVIGDENSYNSPMKTDSDYVKSPLHKTPLKSIENVIGNHVEDMNTSPSKTPLKNPVNLVDSDIVMSSPSQSVTNNVTKAFGSAVKLLSNTVSGIVNMVTPEKSKTPVKSRRKSVCASPWLAKTPKSGNANVVNEELLISPDGCRPLMGTGKKKFNIPLTSQALTEARMNSTIMSAFSNSPTQQRRISESSSHSGGSLGETFVEESPSPKKRPHCALVQDSPVKSCDVSRIDNSSSVIIDSVQNSPVVNDNNHNKFDINDSLKGFGRSSLGVEESSNDNSPSIVQKMDNSVIDESGSEEGIEDASLIAKTKRKTKRKAVIESSDEESDENVYESMDSENELDLEESSTNMVKPRKNRIISESNSDQESDESVRGAKASKVTKNKFIDDDDDDDESEEEYGEEYEDDSFIDDEELSEEDEFESLPNSLKSQFNSLVQEGRLLYKKKKYADALVNILQALEIHQNDELQAMALKINKKLQSA